MNKTTVQISVSGYISEVVCGHIPFPAKEAFTSHLLKNRIEAEIPEWLKKRNPNYVSPEHIKRLWYFENEEMEDVMKKGGFVWHTYREVDDLCHRAGFGSGKGDIGLFEISVVMDDKKLVEFVPFEPTIETKQRLAKIADVKQTWLDPERLPSTKKGHIAVIAGSWAKGSMIFNALTHNEFDEHKLEIVLADLTNLGIGEDHYVDGLRYDGEDLVGEIVRETDKEMYQVLWYSPKKHKWLDMYESE